MEIISGNKKWFQREIDTYANQNLMTLNIQNQHVSITPLCLKYPNINHRKIKTYFYQPCQQSTMTDKICKKAARVVKIILYKKNPD